MNGDNPTTPINQATKIPPEFASILGVPAEQKVKYFLAMFESCNVIMSALGTKLQETALGRNAHNFARNSHLYPVLALKYLDDLVPHCERDMHNNVYEQFRASMVFNELDIDKANPVTSLIRISTQMHEAYANFTNLLTEEEMEKNLPNAPLIKSAFETSAKKVLKMGLPSHIHDALKECWEPMIKDDKSVTHCMRLFQKVVFELQGPTDTAALLSNLSVSQEPKALMSKHNHQAAMRVRNSRHRDDAPDSHYPRRVSQHLTSCFIRDAAFPCSTRHTYSIMGLSNVPELDSHHQSSYLCRGILFVINRSSL